MISRRSLLQILGLGGLAAVGAPVLAPLLKRARLREPTFDEMSPIDRTIGEMGARKFSGDQPSAAHKVLWNKHGFIDSIGGSLPEPEQEVPLVVVGGGVSGLFTAYQLRHHRPVLLEQAERFGGNAKAESWRGIDYALGAAYYTRFDEGTPEARLLDEVGASAVARLKDTLDPVVYRGKTFLHFWRGDTDPKNRSQFVRLAKHFDDVCNERNGEIFPEIPCDDPKVRKHVDALDRISFLSYLEKVVGGKLHPHILAAIEHYCWSSFDAGIDEVSAAHGMNFYAGEFGDVVVMPGGNAGVAEKVLASLARELPPGSLKPGSLVFDVRVEGEGVRVSYVDPSGRARALKARAVVMACPKFVVARILHEIEPERVEAIRKLKYRSYLVANVLLKKPLRTGADDDFYDMFLLGDAQSDGVGRQKDSEQQKVTDVVSANFAIRGRAPAGADAVSVLTLYRGMPYEGARPDLLSGQNVFERYRAEFETQVKQDILPLVGMKDDDIADLRVARWGHPLPVAATGLIADGTIDRLRKPFRDRVFFVEQDNWALPALETALTESVLVSPAVEKVLSS